MKLVFVIYKYFEHDEFQRDFIRIAKASQNAGHEVNVITTSWNSDIPKEILISEIKVSGLTNHAKMESFAKEVKNRASDIKPDLIIGFNKMPGLDFYFASDICSKTKLKSKKLLLKILPRNRSYLQLEKSVFSPKSKTKIFYLTPKQKEEYVKAYQTQDERFFFLPAGIKKTDRLEKERTEIRKRRRLKLNVNDDEMAVLFVGSSFYNKGLDRAIKALANIENEKVKMFVFGSDQQKKYTKIAKQHGLRHRLFFLGTTDELKEYMLAADLLLHPARIEAAGVVLLEAIIAGLPTITTENCGYAFHVKTAGGIAVDFPFNQKTFDHHFLCLMDKSARQSMQFMMMEYAKNANLYNMEEQAVEFIEQGVLS